MRRQYLVQFRLFCRWALTGFHFPHVQCICGIFLDNISTREQFAYLVYCYRVKAIFHNLCTVLYWRLCDLKLAPLLIKYRLNWDWCAWSAAGYLKQWLPNGKLLLLSLTKCHGVPSSLPSRITTKVLKNCKTFSSRPRPRPRPNVQDQNQDFMIQDQDQDSFLSSRRLETKTLVSRTTSLAFCICQVAFSFRCKRLA